ncbi:MAG: family 65 glycosyl hydrolase [Bacilli bacterium]|nr:family 65 glycosyl hydrolase [Bacilli bacterium]
MAKVSNKYLEVDPYLIIEKGFHQDRHQVSESIFSLSNEYVGVRGFFEEDISLPHLIGTYFNGVIEVGTDLGAPHYKGVVNKTHFTLNSVNFLKCHIDALGETLDLCKVSFDNYLETLDMRSGLLKREFVWNVKDIHIYVSFERLLDMERCKHAYQRITFRSDKDVELTLSMSLDFGIVHWGKTCYWNDISVIEKDDIHGVSSKTITTNQEIISLQRITPRLNNVKTSNKELDEYGTLKLTANKDMVISKHIFNHVVDGDYNIKEFVKELKDDDTIDQAILRNKEYFRKVYERSDIIIEGSDLDQQGIRYCIFQLEQTYHGYSKNNNIGAKGLTGEAYSGHAFWDSETYCLPYYLFSNQASAKNLLMFRYETLGFAKERAKDLDCEGACYPIATRNGEEACTLWQHASCQIQPTTAVGYAIFHYMNIYHDDEFMKKYGLEMILEICKFLLTRGQYNMDNTYFGYYGVMGPDEFQLMVNHNTYTNYMGKKMFEYLFTLLDNPKYHNPELLKKCGYTDELLKRMRDASDKMLILYDDKTKLFEQHDGYYKLPHIDIHSIPVTDFPLYSHWSYDRIYRNDIIKQPDVLMFMFLYPSDFTYEQKKANYEYYEPRCIHESSLSPSIHSIFASELGKEDEALNFFNFATRLDLDDYNRNTCEGLHMTSIAAAWMNIVYGFLGLRSDKEQIELNPTLPKRWNKYRVNLYYQNRIIKSEVNKDYLNIDVIGESITLKIYGKDVRIDKNLRIKRS